MSITTQCVKSQLNRAYAELMVVAKSIELAGGLQTVYFDSAVASLEQGWKLMQHAVEELK